MKLFQLNEIHHTTDYITDYVIIRFHNIIIKQFIKKSIQ